MTMRFRVPVTIAAIAILSAVQTTKAWAVDEADSLALVALYNSTDGDNWTNNTNWMSINPVSTWYGVTVNGDRVTTLNLSGNNVNGSITSQIGDLTALEYLGLHVNQLYGSIPPEIGNLTLLTNLHLEYNQLAGSIPSQLGNLTLLWNLILNTNQLSGSIPTQIGNLTLLENLVLHDNQLSGSIPSAIGNLTLLKYLSLGGNQFSGSIPSEICELDSLRYLGLHSNQLSGSIPPEIGNLTLLTVLHLDYNQLAGSIPTQIGNLTTLWDLTLNTNQLSGSIPTQIGNLTLLENLVLHDNQLSGSIPSAIGNLLLLKYLSLGGNHLSGSIPSEICSLDSLNYLGLHANQLSGSIPSQIGNLKILETFYVRNNQLSDDIPSTITNLTKLNSAFTDLGYNMLFSGNPTVITFLNSKDPDWAETQTLPPTNISSGNITAFNVDISWDTIPYTGDNGGYTIHFGMAPGGPYPNSMSETAGKTIDNLTVSGLTPNEDYYFVVTTHTPPHDSQQNDLVSDYSEEVHARTAMQCLITVTSPNGGEIWCGGESEDITWTSQGTSGNVQIEYSTNGGSNWQTVIASTSDDGTHPWTVPGTPSSNCLVKVCDVSDPECCNESDGSFSICNAPQADFTASPTSGQGDECTLQFTDESSGCITGWYWNFGDEETSSQENPSHTFACNGPFTVTLSVAGPCGSDAEIKFDYISCQCACTIIITSPAGGEIWCVGDHETITWTSDETGGSVKIEYSTNGGSRWFPIISDTPDDGSYEWTIPNLSNLPSTACLIRICDVANLSCCDRSDGSFQMCDCGSIVILSESLPDGTQNCSYSASLDAGDGCLPYTWSIASGSLPSGLVLGPSTGTVSGIPEDTGFFEFAVRISGGDGGSAEQELSIQVDEYANIKGDVDGDCRINVIDIVLLNNCLIFDEECCPDNPNIHNSVCCRRDVCPPDEDMIWRADCNGIGNNCPGDGDVNVLDAVKIARIILELDVCP